MLAWLFDLLFPYSCLGCGAFGECICQRCRQSFSPLTATICPRCLKETQNGKRHADCGGYIEKLISCWNYEGNVRRIIKLSKYQYYYSGIDHLTDQLVQTMKVSTDKETQVFLQAKPIVVPVPLHCKRYRRRGFNQADHIAKRLAVLWSLSYSNQLIQRHQHTHPQASLKKKQRHRNLLDAFSPTHTVSNLGNKPLGGREVLLVDDIWTTGSTMQQCAKVLKQLGAEAIWAVTLAR